MPYQRSSSYCFPKVLVVFALLCVVTFQFGPWSSHPWSSVQGQASLAGIPKKIWQINLASVQTESLIRTQALTWLTTNAGYTYTLMSDQGAKEFISKSFPSRPEIFQLYSGLNTRVLQADYLRYLLLAAEGGVYTDLDTEAKKSIDDWIPSKLHSKVRAVVGLEYDAQDDVPHWGGMQLPVQFCQWTLMSAPGHPLLANMVDHVTQAIPALAATQGHSIGDIRPSEDEILATTGPVAWSKVVFAELSRQMGEEISWRNITGMKDEDGGRLFGDILVLPINAFGTGQEHSGSVREGSEHALLRHTFSGSWRGQG
jgi:alpha 1,6-mannosyltransferase